MLFKAYGLCSHTVAIAELNGTLRDYINGYNLAKKPAKLSALSDNGLPGKRGCKATKRTSVRRGPVVKRAAVDSYANVEHFGPHEAQPCGKFRRIYLTTCLP